MTSLILPQQGLLGTFFYQGETEGTEWADKKEMCLKVLAHLSPSLSHFQWPILASLRKYLYWEQLWSLNKGWDNSTHIMSCRGMKTGANSPMCLLPSSFWAHGLRQTTGTVVAMMPSVPNWPEDEAYTPSSGSYTHSQASLCHSSPWLWLLFELESCHSHTMNSSGVFIYLSSGLCWPCVPCLIFFFPKEEPANNGPWDKTSSLLCV